MGWLIRLSTPGGCRSDYDASSLIGEYHQRLLRDKEGMHPQHFCCWNWHKRFLEMWTIFKCGLVSVQKWGFQMWEMQLNVSGGVSIITGGAYSITSMLEKNNLGFLCWSRRGRACHDPHWSLERRRWIGELIAIMLRCLMTKCATMKMGVHYCLK